MSKPAAGSAVLTAHPLAPHVGSWPFNEASGPTVTDGLLGAVGTLSAGVVWATSAGVSVLSWPTPNVGYVTVPAASLPAFGPALTVVCSVKANAARSGPDACMFVERAPVNGSWSLFVENGLLIWRGSSGSDRASASLAGIGWTDAVDHTVGVTDDGIAGGTPQLYVDGVPVGSAGFTAGTVGTTGDLTFGAFDGANNRDNLRGSMKWVYLDNAVRSAADMAAIHAAPYSFYPSPARMRLNNPLRNLLPPFYYPPPASAPPTPGTARMRLYGPPWALLPPFYRAAPASAPWVIGDYASVLTDADDANPFGVDPELATRA